MIKIQKVTRNRGRRSGAFDVESKPAMGEEKVEFVWWLRMKEGEKERRRDFSGRLKEQACTCCGVDVIISKRSSHFPNW